MSKRDKTIKKTCRLFQELLCTNMEDASRWLQSDCGANITITGVRLTLWAGRGCLFEEGEPWWPEQVTCKYSIE